MFADRFSPLIKAFPQEADAIRRVADHFGDIELRDGARVLDVEMNPGRLFDVSQAGSSARFAKVTTILIEAGILVRRYVIRSPMGPEILELASWYDCPRSVYDPLRDVTMEVGDGDVETMYSVVKDGDH